MNWVRGFPHSLKQIICLQCRKPGSILGQKDSWEGKQVPTPVCLLENPIDRRADRPQSAVTARVGHDLAAKLATRELIMSLSMHLECGVGYRTGKLAVIKYVLGFRKGIPFEYARHSTIRSHLSSFIPMFAALPTIFHLNAKHSASLINSWHLTPWPCTFTSF